MRFPTPLAVIVYAPVKRTGQCLFPRLTNVGHASACVVDRSVSLLQSEWSGRFKVGVRAPASLDRLGVCARALPRSWESTKQDLVIIVVVVSSGAIKLRRVLGAGILMSVGYHRRLCLF